MHPFADFCMNVMLALFTLAVAALVLALLVVVGRYIMGKDD